MMRLLSAFLLLLMTALIPGATTAAPMSGGWLRTVTQTPEGAFVWGNPRAVHKIVEYASYTCPHCAHFEADGMPVVKSRYVAPGLFSFELRNLVRDRYDLTAALIARCGGPSRFFGNHQAIFAWQSQWLPRLQAYESAPPLPEGTSQTAILQDIADKTGLNALMVRRGFTVAQLRACVADPKALSTILAMRQKGLTEMNITGTPSFLIDGTLSDAHDWATLAPLLQAALPGRRI